MTTRKKIRKPANAVGEKRVAQAPARILAKRTTQFRLDRIPSRGDKAFRGVRREEVGSALKTALSEGDFVDASPAVRLTPGDMIREVRELQGLSQAALANLTGLTQAAISALENGTQTLGLDRAKVLARALKVHPAVLAFPDWNIEEESA